MLQTALPLSLFSETREKFWKRQQLIQKPRNRLVVNRTIVFKTMFNCSHARIKNVISQLLPDLECTVCYKSTVTLANLCM